MQLKFSSSFIFYQFKFLAECDEVIYIKEGSITERGSHSELSKASGDYSQMLTFDHARTVKKDNSTDDVELKTAADVLPG